MYTYLYLHWELYDQFDCAVPLLVTWTKKWRLCLWFMWNVFTCFCLCSYIVRYVWISALLITYLSTRLSIYLSIYLFIYISSNLSTYLSISPSSSLSPIPPLLPLLTLSFLYHAGVEWSWDAASSTAHPGNYEVLKQALAVVLANIVNYEKTPVRYTPTYIHMYLH